MGGASSSDQMAQTSNSSLFSKEELNKLNSAYDAGGMKEVTPLIQKKLDDLDNTELNIAVTGKIGSGKSTFINAMRGLQNDDEGAAETGVTIITMEPTSYSHPNLPNVYLWDLPGIQHIQTVERYVRAINFARYDFIIIISGCRVTENDIKLANEIKRLGKNFYFVYSKIDNDLDAMRKRSWNFNEVETLEKIRNYCISKLQEAGIPSPSVFLISNFDLNLYDFICLNKTLEDDLLNIKSDFILVLQNLNSEIVEKKRTELKKRLQMLATRYRVAPGLSLAHNFGILIGAIIYLRKCMGLDDVSLQRLANNVGKPVEDLKAVMTTPLVGGEITEDIINRLAWRATAVIASAPELTVNTNPDFGEQPSFLTTNKLLNTALDDLTENAQRVVMVAFGTPSIREQFLYCTFFSEEELKKLKSN
ncbi:interferon-inducible GTPase 5-like isoform X2 [Chiloscyllium plagiosum]|uniref:interferon-inducible GTPase 5-like isoform X2 n=1 Tax=Chiloscyllium plagiosum TaxID=36176 RepID=UPI001CB87871|nr:interferon-inducible GTPase 5-like isoform X2 [Chiloscyllium plagiosum]